MEIEDFDKLAKLIPTAYLNYIEAFSKAASNILSLHCLYNYKIKLEKN